MHCGDYEFLSDKKLFQSVKYQVPTDTGHKVSALSECMLFESNNVITPCCLCCTVHVHHEYGSQMTVHILHTYGLWVSYQEVCCFLTSVALEEIESAWDGVFSRQHGGLLIHEGYGNIYNNVQATDWTNIFHSMTWVIFQVKSTHEHHRINKHQLSEALENTFKFEMRWEKAYMFFPFKKPLKIPEPSHLGIPFSNSMTPLSRKKDLV